MIGGSASFVILEFKHPPTGVGLLPEDHTGKVCQRSVLHAVFE
jgi:hypothetical protein